MCIVVAKREQKRDLIISKRTPSRSRTKQKTFKFSPTEKKKNFFFVQFQSLFHEFLNVFERVSYTAVQKTLDSEYFHFLFKRELFYL